MIKKFIIFFVFLFFIFNLNAAKIDDDLKDVLNGSNYLLKDFETLSGFLTSEIGKIIGFTSTAGNNTPANVCAFPGLALGGNAGVTIMQFNINGLKSLPLGYLPEEELSKTLPTAIGIWVLNTYLKAGIIGLPFLKAD